MRWCAFPFRVRLGSGLIFFAVALGGYLAGFHLLGMGRGAALMGSFLAALLLAVLANRMRLPGPVLGNDDIIFWFVSQRMFPPIVTAFALFLMYSEAGRAGLKLVDTYWGLTLCYVAFSMPIVVWLMRDFFAALRSRWRRRRWSTTCRPGGSSSGSSCRWRRPVWPRPS